MNRVDRLHAILMQLQSKKVVTAKEIADRFEISLRTVYRDIRALEEGGVPIGAEAGVGYYLSDGYQLPPIMLTKKEAISITMAGKMLEKFVNPEVRSDFSSALAKIKNVLDKDHKEDLENFETKIEVNPFSMHSQHIQNPHIQELQDALIKNLVIEFNYFSNYKQTFEDRTVEPIGLIFYSNHWHLIAWCQKREDYRDFRVDRMSKLHLRSETFIRARRGSIKDYIQRIIDSTDLTNVTISVTQMVSRYIQEAKYQNGWVSEETTDGRITMHFATISLDYFARWLLVMGDQVEIIAPEPLKEKMEALSIKLHEHYK